MTATCRDTSEGPNVPVVERVAGGALTQHLRSEAVQELMSGRVDVVEVKCVAGYIGQASTRGRLRLIRFSTHPPLAQDALTFIICHELAHQVVGPREKHSDAWREACAALVREAGERGLLSKQRVAQGVAMVLDGTATKFRGWPEEADEELARRDEHRATRLDQLREQGLRRGGQVVFRYQGELFHAEVMRINQATVSVGPPGSGQTTLRVPFDRVLRIKEESG